MEVEHVGLESHSDYKIERERHLGVRLGSLALN